MLFQVNLICFLRFLRLLRVSKVLCRIIRAVIPPALAHLYFCLSALHHSNPDCGSATEAARR